jgi:hypothetical protein
LINTSDLSLKVVTKSIIYLLCRQLSQKGVELVEGLRKSSLELMSRRSSLKAVSVMAWWLQRVDSCLGWGVCVQWRHAEWDWQCDISRG